MWNIFDQLLWMSSIFSGMPSILTSIVLNQLRLYGKSKEYGWDWELQPWCYCDGDDKKIILSQCLCCSFVVWFEGNLSKCHHAQNEHWEAWISDDLQKAGEVWSDQGEMEYHVWILSASKTRGEPLLDLVPCLVMQVYTGTCCFS